MRLRQKALKLWLRSAQAQMLFHQHDDLVTCQNKSKGNDKSEITCNAKKQNTGTISMVSYIFKDILFILPSHGCWSRIHTRETLRLGTSSPGTWSAAKKPAPARWPVELLALAVYGAPPPTRFTRAQCKCDLSCSKVDSGYMIPSSFILNIRRLPGQARSIQCGGSATGR